MHTVCIYSKAVYAYKRPYVSTGEGVPNLKGIKYFDLLFLP